MSVDELRDARADLYRTFLTLLELSWSDRELLTDAAIITAADDLDDAVGQLVEAIRIDWVEAALEAANRRA